MAARFGQPSVRSRARCPGSDVGRVGFPTDPFLASAANVSLSCSVAAFALQLTGKDETDAPPVTIVDDDPKDDMQLAIAIEPFVRLPAHETFEDSIRIAEGLVTFSLPLVSGSLWAKRDAIDCRPDYCSYLTGGKAFLCSPERAQAPRRWCCRMQS